MDIDVSPYMETTNSYQYSSGNIPQYTSIQMPYQQPQMQQIPQINQSQPMPQPSLGKKTIDLFSDITLKTVMYIILVILLLYLLYTYFNGKSDWFRSSGSRSDPAHDESYLEEKIELLNDMQEKNLETL